MRTMLSLCAWFAATVLAPPSMGQTYTALTNPFSTQTHFNVETVRGLAFDSTGPQLWAINTHGSRLARLTLPGGVPERELLATVNNPVALAMWEPRDGSARVLVVGGGTHGLVMHDAVSGEILFYADLPSEPSDIVVDPDLERAFVSCANEDLVVSIDLPSSLTAGTLVGTEIAIPATRPTFLDFDPGSSPDGSDNIVRVAPLLSGNRTTHTDNGLYAHVVRLGPGDGLPDQDLFEIETSTGAVSSSFTGVGTLLTAHGRHPDGSYWMLGTESFNEKGSEPENKGVFAENRLVVSKLGTVITPNQIHSLDGRTSALFAPATLPGEPSPDKPVSFPWGLSFRPDGIAAVAGSTSDTIRFFYPSPTGGGPIVLKNVALASGSIPRSVLFSPDGSVVWIYCWGTNEVLGFDFNALLFQSVTTPTWEWDLGPDPQPQAVKNGRRTWYDADNSQHRNLTCNHCHPGGALDLLGWELSDKPFDHKEVMVTQSLKSIEDTFPYHWRGERNLAEFNGAFSGLLGGDDLGASELEDFEEFIFSLQVPANPRQDPSRTLSGAVAIAGQDAFNTTPTLPGFIDSTCASCHGNETGSNGIITQDNAISFVPTNTNMDVAHLRQLEAKIRQPAVTVTSPALNGGLPTDRPRIGFGLSHNGDDIGVEGFVDPAVFSITPQEQITISEFVRQFDQGIAPRVHSALLMNSSNSAAAALRLTNEFLPQALSRWLEVSVVGTWSSGQTAALFLTDPATGTFQDRFGNAVPLTNLTTEASIGASLLFVMVAPGNARRFAVDPDNDGLDATGELYAMTDGLVSDTDGDGYPDGFEVSIGTDPTTATTKPQVQAADFSDPSIVQSELDFATGRIARFLMTYSEPVATSVQLLRRDPASGVFGPVGAPQFHASRLQTHALVAQEMRASTSTFSGAHEEYRFEVTMWDYAGNVSTETIRAAGGSELTVQTDDTVLPFSLLPAIVTQSLSESHPIGQPTQPIDLTVTVQNEWDLSFLPLDQTTDLHIVLQIATLGVDGTWNLVTPLANDPTQVVPIATLGQSGPFQLPLDAEISADGDALFSPATVATGTAGVGSTTLRFWMPPGTPAGTKVRASIIGITDQSDPAASLAPVVTAPIWLMPLSPASARMIEFTL